LPEPIHVILKSFIAANDGAPRGLAPTSEAALQIAKADLADAVLDELNNDTLDAKSPGRHCSAVAKGLLLYSVH